MKNKLKAMFGLALCLSILWGVSACKTPTLEPGGAYSPTNATGVVLYNDRGLALADATYKFAYESTLAVFKFEKDNRVAIFAIDPAAGLKVKHALDKSRLTVRAIDLRWANARKMYRTNPTPAGLSTLQTILAEMQRVLPVVQAQINPVYATLNVKP